MRDDYQQSDDLNDSKFENFLSNDSEDNFFNSLDFIKFLLVVRKNLIYIILIFIFCISGAYLYLRYTVPIYQSSSVLKLEFEGNTNVLKFTGGGGSENTRKLTGEIELIKSNLVLNKVINNLSLNLSYYSEGNVKDDEKYKNSPFKVDYKIKNDRIRDNKIFLEVINPNQYLITYNIGNQKFTKKRKFGKTYENKWMEFNITLNDKKIDYYNYYFIIHSDKYLLNKIKNNLTVEILNPSAKTIQISYQHSDPHKAQDIVAMIDSVYLVEGLKQNYKSKEQTLTFLDTLLNKTKEDLRIYESKMENFIRKNKTSDISSKFKITMESIKEIEKKVKELKIKLKALNELNFSVKTDNNNLEELMIDLTEIENNNLSQMIGKLNDLYNRKELLKLSHNENTYVIQKINKQINNYKNKIIKVIQASKKSLNEKITELQKEKNALRKKLHSLPDKMTKYKRLSRFYNLYEKFYLRMVERKAEVGIQKAGTVPNFTELSKPNLPSTPIYPKTLMVYGFSGGAAFLICLLLLIVSYFLHNSIDNIGELEKLSLAPVLGYVPKFKMEKMNIAKVITHDNPKSPVSEALRNIRTNLEFISGKDNKIKNITLTSTVSGEGKTFVALNLAGVLALANNRVILLDMDLRKPKIHSSFGVSNDKGLSTLLIGKHQLQECIYSSNYENFDFIPSGPIPPNPSELILKEEFKQLKEQLHEEYDIIIMDTPPTGLVTDGILLMKDADIQLYIVRSEFSKKGFEKNINKLFVQNNFKNLSVILNDFDATKTYGYGPKYGYGYGYGYYEKENKSWLASLFKRK